MFEEIRNIKLDYENGVCLINDQIPEFPVKVELRQPNGWDKVRLMNVTDATKRSGPKTVATITVDLEELQQCEVENRMRKLVREELEYQASRNYAMPDTPTGSMPLK